MHALLAFIFAGICAAYLISMVSRARHALQGQARQSYRRHLLGGGAPRRPRGAGGRNRMRMTGPPSRPQGPGFIGGILGHRRQVAMEKLRHRHTVFLANLKHRNGLIGKWADHAIRMREREADWAHQSPVSTAPPPAAPQAGPGGANPGAPRPAGASPGPFTVPGSVIPGSPGPPPAYGPPSQPSSPSTPQPGGTPMSNPGSVEPVVDGLQRVHQHAAAGNIRAKQWAIKVCAEVCARVAQMLLMMSRTLSERGYGPEISEPLARAGTMTQAAAMACGESDTAITSLANMTVGDLADSPRQAPHREELSETGAH